MPALTGRTAIVSGGARGIGFAIVEALAEAGTRVIACDVSPDIDDVGADLRARGLAVQTVVADVSMPADIRRMVDDAGPVSILINNAGVVKATRPTDPWQTAVADFDAVIGPNLRGAYLLGRAVIP